MERKEAQATGLAQYFTGRPCSHGHTAYRYTVSGGCSDCIKSARYGSLLSAQPRIERASAPRVPVETMAELNNWRTHAYGTAIVATMYPAQTTRQILEFYAALCWARHPTLPWSTWARPTKIADGGCRMWLPCYPEDEDTLRNYGRDLDREIRKIQPLRLGPNLEALRQLDALEEAANPWPTHDPR